MLLQLNCWVEAARVQCVILSNLKMDFKEFLTLKLRERKIDVSVYHSYLMGILEDNLDEQEKRENVSDILGSLIVCFVE